MEVQSVVVPVRGIPGTFIKSNKNNGLQRRPRIFYISSPSSNPASEFATVNMV